MIQFQWHSFTELTLTELYTLLAFRSAIFVVEQNCAYLDPDGQDPAALHLLGTENDTLVAYARLFPPTKDKKEIIFGRVATAQSAHGKRYGKLLLQTLLNYCQEKYPNIPIKCSAQVYLQKFYESFGFKTAGDVYDEDGIPHVGMGRQPPPRTSYLKQHH